MVEKTYVVNADGYKLGRLASRVAKLLLQGHNVKIYNAEKALITGTKRSLLQHYLMLRGRRQFKSHKVVSVWYPTLPHAILRYSILRMLPRKKARGRAAAKRLEVKRGDARFVGDLIEFEDAKLLKPVNRSGKIIRYMTLEELSKLLSGGVS